MLRGSIYKGLSVRLGCILGGGGEMIRVMCFRKGGQRLIQSFFEEHGKGVIERAIPLYEVGWAGVVFCVFLQLQDESNFNKIGLYVLNFCTNHFFIGPPFCTGKWRGNDWSKNLVRAHFADV